MKFDPKNLVHLKRLRREFLKRHRSGHIVEFRDRRVVNARVSKAGMLEVLVVYGWVRWEPVKPKMLVDSNGDPLHIYLTF